MNKLQKLPTSLIGFVLILLSSICVSATDHTTLQSTPVWKETTINYPYGSSREWYEWCGSDNKRLIVQFSDNIKHQIYFGLIDVESGRIEEIRETPVSLNPSCSPDGRYVFFQKRPFGGDVVQKNLYAYDTRTKKTSLIYASDRALPFRELKEPMSPSGQYLIGPDQWQEKVVLPGGEELEVIALPIKKTKKGKPMDFNDIRWSWDGNRLFLYGHEDRNVYVLDPKTKQATTIPIKIKGAFLKKYVYPSPDNTKIYITGFFGNFMEGTTNLYAIDLKSPRNPPKLIAKDIDDYGVCADGTIIFSRANIHPKERGNFAHGIYLYDKSGKITLIKEIRDIAGFGYIYVSMRVSRDGNTIIYPKKISKTEEVMAVLRKESKNW